MSVEHLKSFYQTLCKHFDKEVMEEHNGEIRVMFGVCPDHFFTRMIQRINGDNFIQTREKVLAAAFKFVLLKYSFFSKLHENYELSVVYHGWKICYKCYVITPDSQPRYIEVVPVTMFRYVKK